MLKKIQKIKTFFKKDLTIKKRCAIMYKHVNETRKNLGVAQLVARYLGVVEAASSSLVTQTSIFNKMHKK